RVAHEFGERCGGKLLGACASVSGGSETNDTAAGRAQTEPPEAAVVASGGGCAEARGIDSFDTENRGVASVVRDVAKHHARAADDKVAAEFDQEGFVATAD